MTDREIKLVSMSISEMGADEYNRILKLVADVKRVNDLLALIPSAKSQFEEDAEGFIKANNLDLTVYDLQYTFSSDYDEVKSKALASPDFLKLVPESFYRYRQFVMNKIAFRDRMRDKLCVPTNKQMAVWRERQINRCNGDIGGANGSFIHAPICYELSDGCSVGCDFCGLGAGKLKSLFRYTDENAKLFNEVIRGVYDVIGPGAGLGMMYFASEALDNPDYEKFEADYYKVFGILPQITTAVPERDIERTRALIGELAVKKGYVHRFSLRSLDTAKKILDSFTPLELLNVELLPQYEEAPAFIPFTVVGNEAKKNNIKSTSDKILRDTGKSSDAGSICCIDGFCVNFVKKTVKLFTPCHMDDNNPNGIAIAAEASFKDGADFKEVLNKLIREYMVNEMPADEPLRLYDYFDLDKFQGRKVLISRYGGEKLYLESAAQALKAGAPNSNADMEALIVRVIELLQEGKHNKSELVAKAHNDTGADYEVIFYLLMQLWKQGYIVESKFFR